MSIDFTALQKMPRLVIEAVLAPIAGTRLQPTGFPDLGPAVYEDADGKSTLLVESAQSMANRFEAVCWDEATEDIVPELKGMPFVKVDLVGLRKKDPASADDEPDTTYSLLEFHRLNSPYIMSGETTDGRLFADVLKQELKLGGTAKKDASTTDTDKDGDDVAGVVNLRRLAKVCFKYDPNSLVHGIFLEKIAGRLRLQRALSAFIEATDVRRADSGGVKFDRVLPKPSGLGLKAEAGYGNVPFHRTEFTARSICAYFTLDLAQLRGHGLPQGGWELLAVLSLWKVRRFLETGFRLRSACDLQLKEDERSLVVKHVPNFVLPSTDELAAQMQALLEQCTPHFATPTVTQLKWNGEKKKPEKAGGKPKKK